MCFSSVMSATIPFSMRFSSRSGNGAAFHKGREFAAWMGVVPREHCNGGQQKLLCSVSANVATLIRSSSRHGMAHFDCGQDRLTQPHPLPGIELAKRSVERPVEARFAAEQAI
jgi:hypothetical protein